MLRASILYGGAHLFCRAILVAERVALNFLQRMSGIATLTRRMVDAVQVGSALLETHSQAMPLPRCHQLPGNRAQHSMPGSSVQALQCMCSPAPPVAFTAAAAGHAHNSAGYPQDGARPAPAGQVGGADRRRAEPQDRCGAVVGGAGALHLACGFVHPGCIRWLRVKRPVCFTISQACLTW